MRNTPPLFLAQCGCCKKIKACTHIGFWSNIAPHSDLVSCEEPLAAVLPPEEVIVPTAPVKKSAVKKSVLG